ncbi:late secretory pathway protein AVL9 homolog [Diabrotica virgifera virgifera]|uniref:Late secretory pathway protein AVL9 homolog n=1 Tax=Diabrotica virgifera virgifera TaxID=50390 RepID=A0A6P7GJD2_DIAVI|nr:late secretory pathway protein AVL9 homolog [Diabrotica virgifera virgifera]
MGEKDGPILYVLVIGFHHKRGCQVEYSFPELVPGHPNECPPGWKYLPTLALPDGSHNYDEDTVFFHLPSLTKPMQTVYGISCFRQIPVEKIKNKTSDITRGTVQKSVCVLSKVPLYGQIQVKMCLITHAYFDEGDFSQVSILKDTYHHLNAVMTQSDAIQQPFVGLSARDFILQWKHKALLLFKLLLLEKRVIFYKSPVHPLCSSILTLISLFPDMIETGLNNSACIRLSRPMSPMPEYSDEDSSPVKLNNIKNIPCLKGSRIKEETDVIQNVEIAKESKIVQDIEKNEKTNDVVNSNGNQIEDNLVNDNQTEVGLELTESMSQTKVCLEDEDEAINGHDGKTGTLHRDLSSDTISDVAHNNLTYLTHLSTESCGFPLAIFTKGALCLPYLSLPYLDLLVDVNVRSYVVGATNVLFKQKRQLYDILVDIDGNRIECQDLNLRKYLHLTTEDLRFADYIVKHVSEERHDVFLDGVGWEGGDEWIRTQFRVYLLCLLRTSMLQDGSREIDHFNSSFITAWRDSHNYKIWLSGINPGILDVHPGHPFAGQLSVADMKLRFSHTMQNTESGRKLNQAMASTGKAVVTTGKAVGGALSHAKGALSSWWSNFMVNPDQGQKALENQSQEESADTNNLTDSLTNIPSSINSDKENNKIETNQTEVNKSENESDIKNVSNGSVICNEKSRINHEMEDNHIPGEVHTV